MEFHWRAASVKESGSETPVGGMGARFVKLDHSTTHMHQLGQHIKSYILSMPLWLLHLNKNKQASMLTASCQQEWESSNDWAPSEQISVSAFEKQKNGPWANLDSFFFFFLTFPSSTNNCPHSHPLPPLRNQGCPLLNSHTIMFIRNVEGEWAGHLQANTKTDSSKIWLRQQKKTQNRNTPIRESSLVRGVSHRQMNVGSKDGVRHL